MVDGSSCIILLPVVVYTYKKSNHTYLIQPIYFALKETNKSTSTVALSNNHISKGQSSFTDFNKIQQ